MSLSDFCSFFQTLYKSFSKFPKFQIRFSLIEVRIKLNFHKTNLKY